MLARGTVSLRDDLQVALDEQGSAETADFSESERTILQNVLKLSNVSVGDVMVERSDIQAIEADVNLGTLIAKFRQAGHSRLPVYDDNLDNILGFIHVKDALGKITQPVTEPGKDVPVKLVSTVLKQKVIRLDLTRDAMFVPTFMPVGDLLQSMRASRVHMAIVIDEYGGTDGLVTIEDLLEAVVGEIEDEHDELAAALIRKVGVDTYIADARAELSDVQTMIGPDFDPGDYAEDVETIGGLVFDLAGHVPKRGERVTKLDGFEFEILAADSRRIKRLRIRRKRDDAAEPLAITDQRSEAEKAAAE
ncbi:MAG: hemolysin family protein [Alphaproteobacteria bacterium]|nr:hemolysin family protein [Alphaproteobacteria bacterium]MBU1562171.1 hemolysin family protein [Alphaproteobacteria bacterium]MBU2302857.1 hemolysin family protein [Alphaproteobacteria bacterium]MBU2368054.1 hemolysin family protein [Alphaproteobacteria bacterium]